MEILLGQVLKTCLQISMTHEFGRIATTLTNRICIHNVHHTMDFVHNEVLQHLPNILADSNASLQYSRGTINTIGLRFVTHDHIERRRREDIEPLYLNNDVDVAERQLHNR